MRAELRLEVRTGNAGAEGCEPTLLIDIEQTTHARKRYGENRSIELLGWIDMPDDARSTAVGNDAGADAASESEKFVDVVRGLGKGNTVGKMLDASEAQREPIGKTLPARMKHARRCRSVDRWVRGEARFVRAGDNCFETCIVGVHTFAEALAKIGERTFGEIEMDGIVAPPVPAAHAGSIVGTGCRDLPLTAAAIAEKRGMRIATACRR